MRRVLVTGANKGIGRAIAQAILEHADDTFVYLGSRGVPAITGGVELRSRQDTAPSG